MNREKISRFPVKFPLRKIIRKFSFSLKDVKALKPLVKKVYGLSEIPEPVFKEAREFIISKTNGSEFYKNVWREISNIEKGETLTYSDIANSLGISKGARSVARACSKNLFPFLIPCHRVIGKNKNSGGYTLAFCDVYKAFNMEVSLKNALLIKKILLESEKNI